MPIYSSSIYHSTAIYYFLASLSRRRLGRNEETRLLCSEEATQYPLPFALEGSSDRNGEKCSTKKKKETERNGEIFRSPGLVSLLTAYQNCILKYSLNLIHYLD